MSFYVHNGHRVCEYPYDISPTICNTCIMYSWTHEHRTNSTIKCNINLTFDIDEDVFDNNINLRNREPVGPFVREIMPLSTDMERHFINNIEHPSNISIISSNVYIVAHPSIHTQHTHIPTVKYSIDLFVSINDGETMFGIIYPRRSGCTLNGIEGCIVVFLPQHSP